MWKYDFIKKCFDWLLNFLNFLDDKFCLVIIFIVKDKEFFFSKFINLKKYVVSLKIIYNLFEILKLKKKNWYIVWLI